MELYLSVLIRNNVLSLCKKGKKNIVQSYTLLLTKGLDVPMTSYYIGPFLMDSSSFMPHAGSGL